MGRLPEMAPMRPKVNLPPPPTKVNVPPPPTKVDFPPPPRTYKRTPKTRDGVSVPLGYRSYVGVVTKRTADGKYLIQFDGTDKPHQVGGKDYGFSSERFSVISERKKRRFWNGPEPAQKQPISSDLPKTSERKKRRFRNGSEPTQKQPSSSDLPKTSERKKRRFRNDPEPTQKQPTISDLYERLGTPCDLGQPGRPGTTNFSSQRRPDRQSHQPSYSYGQVRRKTRKSEQKPRYQPCPPCQAMGRGYRGPPGYTNQSACGTCDGSGRMRIRAPRIHSLPSKSDWTHIPPSTSPDQPGRNMKDMSRPSGVSRVITWNSRPHYANPHAGSWEESNWESKAPRVPPQPSRIPKPIPGVHDL